MLKFMRENKRLILTMMALILGAIILAICFGAFREGQYPLF